MTEPEHRFARDADGAIALRMSRHEREIVRALLLELHDVLDAGAVRAGEDEGEPDGAPAPEADPVLGRLYPPAIPTDPVASAGFARLVRGSLEDGRRRRMAVVEETLDARTLDDAQAEAWLAVLNDVRLVLGTQLGVTDEADDEADDELDELDDDADEEPDDADPDAARMAVYAYVGWLEWQLVELLAAALPDEDDATA